MDNETTTINNGEIGDAGSKQPERIGGIDKPDSGNQGTNSGYIDPEFARRTAGGSSLNSPAGTPGSPDTPKRGRGRPPGSGAKPAVSGQPKAQETGSLNLNGIEKILYSVHAMGAAILQVPELNLDQSEAKKLAASIEAVNAQYKFDMDPKKAAWLDLATTAGIIYGPRCVSFYIRKTQQQKPMPFVRHAAPPPAGDTINQPATAADKPVVINGFDPTNQKIIN